MSAVAGLKPLLPAISKLLGKSRIRGGVHPDGHKSLTSAKPIVSGLPLPKKLFLPLQQHVGQPAEPCVCVGDKVHKGQLLAYSQGNISAPIHAPTSGTVVGIAEWPAPHPSALPTPTLILAPDGLEQWAELHPPADPFALPAEEIALRVGAAGIVGMGGAAFPSAVKLNLGRRSRIHTLLINGGECEPYLTCDDRLMQERAEAVVDGVHIMLHGLRCGTAKVGIEDNKPEACRAMHEAAKNYPHIEVQQIPTHYPMGWDKQLIRYLTGLEVPADGRATDVGVLMHNVATAYAIHQAIRLGRPLVSRIVTVSGSAVNNPLNIEAPIGSLFSELLRHCGWQPEQTARLVMGGPMMGNALPHADLPVVKGTCGILALAATPAATEMPCIRCSRCVSACPVGLLPLEMAGRIKVGQLDGVVDYGIKDCINCGSCSYVCPSKIPLVQYFRYAQSELVARQQAQHKAAQIKRLVEDRQRRLDRIKAAQTAALAAEQAENSLHPNPLGNPAQCPSGGHGPTKSVSDGFVPGEEGNVVVATRRSSSQEQAA